MERCPSGLRCKPGTFVWGQLHRGFESPPLRVLSRQPGYFCIRGRMRTPIWVRADLCTDEIRIARKLSSKQRSCESEIFRARNKSKRIPPSPSFILATGIFLYKWEDENPNMGSSGFVYG